MHNTCCFFSITVMSLIFLSVEFEKITIFNFHHNVPLSLWQALLIWLLRGRWLRLNCISPLLHWSMLLFIFLSDLQVSYHLLVLIIYVQKERILQIIFHKSIPIQSWLALITLISQWLKIVRVPIFDPYLILNGLYIATYSFWIVLLTYRCWHF